MDAINTRSKCFDLLLKLMKFTRNWSEASSFSSHFRPIFFKISLLEIHWHSFWLISDILMSENWILRAYLQHNWIGMKIVKTPKTGNGTMYKTSISLIFSNGGKNGYDIRNQPGFFLLEIIRRTHEFIKCGIFWVVYSLLSEKSRSMSLTFFRVLEKQGFPLSY